MSDPSSKPKKIRSACEKDLQELHRLDNDVFKTSPYPYFVLRQHFDAHGDHLLVVDAGEVLEGYVLFTTSSNGSVSWGLSLAVARDRRGEGLGRLLMRKVLEKLREEGVREARIAVEPTNKVAITLYRSLGFSPEGKDEKDAVREDYFGPGEHRLIMSLKL